VSGTREARRRATSTAIERIAVELALEYGTGAVTVEAICERALISTRTFYNYFPTKDAAIVGSAVAMPSATEIDGFVRSPGSDLLGELIELCARGIPQFPDERDVMTLRMQLLEREPALVSKMTGTFDEMSAELTQAVLRRLEQTGRTAAAEPGLAAEAEMIVVLASAVMYHSMRSHPAVGQDGLEALRRTVHMAKQAMRQMSQD
jgi:AcrR family transcriptional regulator